MRAARAVVVSSILAVVVVGMPTFAALGSPPAARTVELPVTAWGAATPAGGVGALSATGSRWTVSEPIRAGDLVMAGADWGGDPRVEVEVRSSSGGTWGPWLPLRIDGEDVPDPGTPEGDRLRTEISDPVWLGPSDWVQVRASGSRPPSLTLHGVAMNGPSGVDYVSAQARGLRAAWASPAVNILPRSAWDPDDQCKRRGPPRYDADVRYAVVHHTAGSNTYTEAQAAANILAVCLFHVNTRGYDDIAYNFVVDRYGRAYEGRSGGIREAVIGGHALGFNAGSTGIVYLGTFTTEQPPLAARNTMRDLVAWKLDQHHVDPLGLTSEVAGADTGPYRAGDVVSLPTVVGHRDVRATACPGDGGYAYLEGAHLASDAAATGGLKIFGGLPPRVEQPVVGARPVFDVAFSRDTDWEMTITGPAGTAIRTGSGHGRVATLVWDMRDDDGREVPAGTYRARMTAGSATPLETVLTVRPSTERIAGASAAATSSAVSGWAYGEPRRAQAGWPEVAHVIVASASSRGDALVAATLGHSYRAPVLLTPSDHLSPAVAAEVSRLGATTAIVVGDETELPDAIGEALKEQTSVTSVARLGGETPYHTAGRVGWRLVERHSPREAVLVLGEGAPTERLTAEALAAAAFAAAHRFPLLFVTPEELGEATQWVLEQRGWTRVNLVGGKGVVTDELRAAAEEAAGGAPLREIAAADPTETATMLAELLAEHRAVTSRPDPNRRDTGLEAVVAGTASPTDAISAAAAAAERGAAFLLLAPGGLDASPSARAFLADRAEELSNVTAVGGTSVVSASALGSVDAIVRSAGPHRAPPADWEGGITSRFADVPVGNVHRQAIERIADEGVTLGCNSDGTLYCPNGSVSRGQMASFLARALGLDPVEGERFPDVPAEHTHARTINAIADAGVTGGFDDGTFRPERPVTRAQMATFIARAAGLEPIEGERFPDVPADHAHAGRINAIVDAGIARGLADGTFGPDLPVTRAQMATFLSNALDRGL